MSKPSRRRQPLSPTPGSRPATPTPGGRPAAPTAAQPATPSSAREAEAGTPAQTRPSFSPSGSSRVGRRERARAGYKPSAMERYRTPIVAAAVIAGAVLVSVFVFASAAAPAYACSTEWAPDPTPNPTAGASPNPGYVQPDMGQRHAPLGEKVTYTYCPPASGPHVNAAGAGPIQPRFYRTADVALPSGWIHNLEHGAMAILYRGLDGDPGTTDEGQAQLAKLFDDFPPSPVCGIQAGTSQGPVIARFDQMATPYAAVVWGRALPLEQLDSTQILEFWRIWGERSHPEPQCAPPTAAPAPTPAPSVEASPAASPSAS